MSGLVLSLFPGIGLLDMAFEEAGFCVVRGPDLLWGGDVRRFHPPVGRFDGVIGGPPCQTHSTMARLVRFRGYGEKPCLIHEFERCVAAAGPGWFLMENVPAAPIPAVPGYGIHHQLLRDVWCGGETLRLRRFSYGSRDGRRLVLELPALHRPDPECSALASGTSWNPRNKRAEGRKTAAVFRNHKRLQGLPDDFDLPPFTIEAKVEAIGNGVPFAMGRAVAAAVVRALLSNVREVA